jgi:hypothetical protein
MLEGRKSSSKPLSTIPAILLYFLAVSCLHACGGGAIVVSAGKPGNPVTGEPGETNLLDSLHPSAIRIPDIASLEGYAYVVDTRAPSGIFRLDLAHDAPYPFDYLSFRDYEVFRLGAIPDELLVLDEDHAFLTTSGGLGQIGEAIHLFDPTPEDPDRPLTASVPVFQVDLDPVRLDSAGGPVSDLLPSFTSGVAASNGKLYVCTSNFSRTGRKPVCPPGTILIYRWNPESNPANITPSDPSHIVTTRYNPTEVTALGDRFVLVTNTGVISIEKWAVPKTDGSVDVIDSELDCIVATYPLGLGAPSYKPIAITPDRSRALLGSVAYNYVYELDLTVLDDYVGSCPDDVPRLDDAVLAGFENPVLVGSVREERANDFIVQVELNSNGTRAYATGANSGTLSILEVETREGVASPKSAGQVLSLTPSLDPQENPPDGEKRMPGPLAVRPGRSGIDYSGPDLFVLTGWPNGKMLSIQTY